MKKNDDRIFQLSLTEIAFTVAFLLLLLLGGLVANEQTGRQAAQAELARLREAERTTADQAAAEKSLTDRLQAMGMRDPDEVISKLVVADAVRADRDRLKRRVDDLDARLSALTEVKNNAEENQNLRGQVAYLKSRLEARGGRDYPPCWADEAGKIDYLFTVDLRPDSVRVAPAWPAQREAAARAMPGMAGLLAGALSYQAFAKNVQGVFDWSKAQSPECRHYVQLRNEIPDAVQSDRARLMVEGYFYKSETRR